MVIIAVVAHNHQAYTIARECGDSGLIRFLYGIGQEADGSVQCGVVTNGSAIAVVFVHRRIIAFHAGIHHVEGELLLWRESAIILLIAAA